MSDQLTMDALGSEVRQRLDAISEQVSSNTSDEKLRQLITEAIDGLKGDEEFVRKIRFGAASTIETQLVGTKYARWGLSIGDVEFLHDLMTAHRGQRLIRGGTHPGPDGRAGAARRPDPVAGWCTPGRGGRGSRCGAGGAAAP